MLLSGPQIPGVLLVKNSAHQCGSCSLNAHCLPAGAQWTSTAWHCHWPRNSALSVPLVLSSRSHPLSV